MATSGQRHKQHSSSSSRSTTSRRAHGDEAGVIPVLARVAREVEAAAQRGPVKSTNRAKFQVAAVLLREERARIKADREMTDAARANEQKRLDGLAGILAKTAARDTSLITLLADDAPITTAARELKRDLLLSAGVELSADELIVVTEPKPVDTQAEKQVVPESVRQFARYNPFLAPDFSNVPAKPVENRSNRLGNWELIEPLFRSFEYGAGGGSAVMDLPEAKSLETPGVLDLMRHQAQLIESARDGHRTYLLADEPGLGKTAQALLAAHVSNSYPLLVVVPNVVKMNWAREVERWTPKRAATVVHGDGDDIDAFADVVIVNYEVLDRHVNWLAKRGFRGMVVDEAHFIKNKESQRSKNVLSLSKSIRALHPRALFMALTGTPLINQIDDFRMIWQFLGWIDDKKPLPDLMDKLEDTGLTPADFGFFAEAQAVRDRHGHRATQEGGCRRRHPGAPHRRHPGRARQRTGPVDPRGRAGPRRRLVDRYRRVLANRQTPTQRRRPRAHPPRRARRARGIEVAEDRRERVHHGAPDRPGEGRARRRLHRQLARNVGKVVFFAKHIDVMDQAEAVLRQGGPQDDQHPRRPDRAVQRQKQIDAFSKIRMSRSRCARSPQPVSA